MWWDAAISWLWVKSHFWNNRTFPTFSLLLCLRPFRRKTLVTCILWMLSWVKQECTRAQLKLWWTAPQRQPNWWFEVRYATALFSGHCLQTNAFTITETGKKEKRGNHFWINHTVQQNTGREIRKRIQCEGLFLIPALSNVDPILLFKHISWPFLWQRNSIFLDKHDVGEHWL